MIDENDEAGFTLIEILIATMITAVILTVLTGSFLVFLQNSSYTSGRDDHAAGAEALSAWLDRDLASATTLSPPVTASNCAASPTILTLSWTQWTAGAHPNDYPSNTGTLYQVNYKFVPDTIVTTRCMVTRTMSSGPNAAGLVQQGPTLPLIRDLVGSSLAAQANVKISTTGPTTCTSPNQPVSVSLMQYHTSATTTDSVIPYTYFGCVNARTNGPSAIS